MRTVIVKTSQIMHFLVNQARGYDNMGLTLKDLYNLLDIESWSIILEIDSEFALACFTLEDLYNLLDVKSRFIILETDSEFALAYLKGKVDMDLNFFYKYIVDKENRFANLL